MMEKGSVLLEKEAPAKGIVAQVVTMLNGQAQRYVTTANHRYSIDRESQHKIQVNEYLKMWTVSAAKWSVV